MDQTIYGSSHTPKVQVESYKGQTIYGSSHTPKVQVESYEGQTVYGSSHTLKMRSMGQVIGVLPVFVRDDMTGMA